MQCIIGSVFIGGDMPGSGPVVFYYPTMPEEIDPVEQLTKTDGSFPSRGNVNELSELTVYVDVDSPVLYETS